MGLIKTRNVVLGCFLSLATAIVSESTAGTYYLSTNGANSNDGSINSPWATFAYAMTRLQAGDVLIIKDGTYNQSLAVTISGMDGKPIIFKAQNDGKVIIDGQNALQPCLISGRQHIEIEGIIFQNSNRNVISVTNSSYIILRRASAYNANPESNYHVFSIASSQNILIEDCASSGTGRNMYLIYEDNYVTLRRCWGRFVSNAQFGSTLHGVLLQFYGSNDCLIENSVFTMDPSFAGWVEGFDVWCHTYNESADRNKILGNVAYALSGWSYSDASSQHRTEGNRFINNVSINCPYGMRQKGDADLQVKNFTAANASKFSFINEEWPYEPKDADYEVMGDVRNSIFYSSDQGFNIRPSQYLKSFYNGYNDLYSIKSPYVNSASQGPGEIQINPGFNTEKYGKGGYLFMPNNSPCKTAGEGGKPMGAEVLYRYQDGVLTNETLWPWPMEDRIMNEVGVSVTWEAKGGIWKTLDNVYASNIDFTPPKVSSTNPGNNAKDVDVTTIIQVTFNEQMDHSSVESAFSIYPIIQGSFAWNGNMVTFDPNENLNANQTFTAKISEKAQDVMGNALDGNADGTAGDAYVWNFTTREQNSSSSIKKHKFTKVGKTQELNQLQKDTWYDLYIYFNTPNSWSEIAYADIWLSQSSYVEGTIANRGGTYYAAKNYIMSFSISSVGIWAKENEGTQNWSNITGTLGTYVNDKYNIYEINKTDGWIKARFKLLNDAKAGAWSINAYVKSKNGVNSALYKQGFECYNKTNKTAQLSSFEAYVKDKAVQLIWQTTTNTNNTEFEIERRCNDEQFQKIGIVGSHYTNNEIEKYQFLDETIEEKRYYSYRLKLINLDESYQYSSTVEIFTELPKQFSLQQNYPNPFNPTTEICYSIPNTTDIYLAIFNPLGQHIVTLIHEKQSPGQRTIEWDGRDKNGQAVSGGLYIYQLKAENFTAYKKMILVK